MSLSAGLSPLRMRREHPGETLLYYLMAPLTWARQAVHNTNGILHVLDITRFRPMPPGLVPLDHPWVTGLNPATGRPIWHDNVLYRSARTPDAPLPADDFVIDKVGQYLANMVARSATLPEIPWGPKRRMPHGINYIHGCVHYNSGLLLFNDFADGYYHFTDPRFLQEVCRFARSEQREVLLLFRQREYTARAFAYFVAFLRTVLPWFCNSNGPQKRVLWGNPSPFPAVNIIAGHWIRDTYRLREKGGLQAVVRPPVPGGRYFQHGPYVGSRRTPRWPEKLLARLTYHRIRRRGAKGGLFFVDREKLMAEELEQLRRQGIADEPIARL